MNSPIRGPSYKPRLFPKDTFPELLCQSVLMTILSVLPGQAFPPPPSTGAGLRAFADVAVRFSKRSHPGDPVCVTGVLSCVSRMGAEAGSLFLFIGGVFFRFPNRPHSGSKIYSHAQKCGHGTSFAFCNQASRGPGRRQTRFGFKVTYRSVTCG